MQYIKIIHEFVSINNRKIQTSDLKGSAHRVLNVLNVCMKFWAKKSTNESDEVEDVYVEDTPA
jgi:hypothetical protein